MAFTASVHVLLQLALASLTECHQAVGLLGDEPVLVLTHMVHDGFARDVPTFGKLFVVAEVSVHVLRAPSPAIGAQLCPLLLTMDHLDVHRALAKEFLLVDQGVVGAGGVRGQKAALEVFLQELLAFHQREAWRTGWHPLLLLLEVDGPTAHCLLLAFYAVCLHLLRQWYYTRCQSECWHYATAKKSALIDRTFSLRGRLKNVSA